MKNGISYRKLSPKSNTSMKKSLIYTNNSVYISPNCNRINIKKEGKQVRYLKTRGDTQTNIKVKDVKIPSKIVQSQLFYSTKANSRSNIKSTYTKDDKDDQKNLTFSFQKLNLELSSPKNVRGRLEQTKKITYTKNKQVKQKKNSGLNDKNNSKINKKVISKMNSSLKDISLISNNQTYQHHQKLQNKKNCVIPGSSKTIHYNRKQNQKKNSNLNNLKKNKNCNQHKNNNTIFSNYNKKDKTQKSSIFLQSWGRQSFEKQGRDVYALIDQFENDAKIYESRARKISLRDLKQSHRKKTTNLDDQNSKKIEIEQIYQKTNNMLGIYKQKLQKALTQIQILKLQNKRLIKCQEQIPSNYFF